MQIIKCTDASIAIGKRAFMQYHSAVVCGPEARHYQSGMDRDKGRGVVIGAISACIEQGMATEDEIINAVARMSRCRRSTVGSVLAALTGKGDGHLWGLANGRYYELNDSIGASLDVERPILIG